jgi:hypothetical protein
MGLDVYAFANAHRIGESGCAGDDDPTVTSILISRDFPKHAQGLTDGEYRFTERRHGVGLGYGRYNDWRDSLARFAGFNSASQVWKECPLTGDFVELINFTDCDGTIGHKLCVKLYNDFRRNAVRAESYATEEWRTYYKDFLAIFKFAAENNGIIVYR